MTSSQYTRTSEPYFSQIYHKNLIEDEEMDPQSLVCKRIPKNLFIDNRDRDYTLDASKGNSAPYSFVIDLQKCGVGRYDTVTTVELKALTFPKISGEEYVIIDIDEFQGAGLLDSTDGGSNQTFGIAFFDGCSSSGGAGIQVGDIKPIKGSDFIQKITEFNPPINISKLHVSFKTYGGNLVTRSQVANVENVSMLLQFQLKNGNLGN